MNRQSPDLQRADLWKGSPDYSVRRLANHFSRIAWLGGSIVVKAIPIPEFGLEWTTLPKAARLVPPWVILSETFVPSGNGSVGCTDHPNRLRFMVRALGSLSDRTSVSSMLAASG